TSKSLLFQPLLYAYDKYSYMQLAGKQVLHAVPAKVWALLMDPDTLVHLVPGITNLEKIGDNSFKSVFDIKLGPVRGSFTGNLQMEDVTENKGYVLKLQQNSKIGNASAVVKIGLVPVGDSQTELDFDGDVKLSGLLASMGQRVIGGVANTLTKQFFHNLEKALEKSVSAR
ncbi:MAG TPA: carbon monoxide dehydrogenase subunit G, partial [Flavisolibacter sp.]|nr:carbon monoxide dehydrogenase subunit G [Flavisolibacter sp.]